MSRRSYRKYDPHLKNLVAESEDISQFHCYGIPNSTLRQWKKNGYQEFISIPELNLSSNQLIPENIANIRDLTSQSCWNDAGQQKVVGPFDDFRYIGQGTWVINGLAKLYMDPSPVAIKAVPTFSWIE